MSDAPVDPNAAQAGFSFSPEEALQFMQRMWTPFGITMPGMAPGGGTAPGAAAITSAGMGFPSPAAMFPSLDPDEIERKIGELRVIEGWLQMSLNFMQMSIKTMELQKASLEALTARHAPPKPGTDPPPQDPRRK